jgi:predicted phage tail protein
MSNNKQSSIEWLVSQLKISTYWNNLISELELMECGEIDILEQAKAMHKDEVESLNARWAKSREQTKDVALSIGVKIGFELALQHYEDYYEQLDKTDLYEDDFMRDYISKIDKQYKQ